MDLVNLFLKITNETAKKTFANMTPPNIQTLGALRQSGYRPQSIRDELRGNLIRNLQAGTDSFSGIFGYHDTVIPQIERAILAGHHINLLGLRGQAKTRIARLLTGLLDEWMPYVAGSEIHDDPLLPLSGMAKQLIADLGDDTPIAWRHRSERYFEKLATPDVTVADLIGDIDPIKAAQLKVAYSDERAIHFGMIPRANRCIFVINELPDLAARIQVALFNILEEGDIQIRGFQLRLPLDIQFLFTANPEDYTNRGSIVTPLKDRIGSQIVTHYPDDIETAIRISNQEARLRPEQHALVKINPLARTLVEQIAFEARDNAYVDEKSGVSARLSITALENLFATAEHRLLTHRLSATHIRLSDFYGVIPAITGKVELVYEGEQEGAVIVAENLIEAAIKTLLEKYFPSPSKLKRSDDQNPYMGILNWFGGGKTLDLPESLNDQAYQERLKSLSSLKNLVLSKYPELDADTSAFLMELVLWGLAAHSKISRNQVAEVMSFADLFSSYLSGQPDRDEED
jgi:magnesium chelatase subunit I